MKLKLSLLVYLITTSLFGQNLNDFFTKSKVKGAISVYDLKKDTWTHSDPMQAKTGTLPASTFKIIHTLIGLEQGVLKSKNDTIRWDRKAKFFKSFKIPNWNKDNDLQMAFKNSTIWYYEEISKQIRKCKYRRHLKRNKYSNRKIRKGKGNDFWNYGQLKVTPIEQIELLIRLYNNELHFEKKHQDLTKYFMLEKETEDFILRSKTGWSYDNTDIGWYIGYIELKDNVIFFATRIEKNLNDKLKGFSRLRKSITYDIIDKLYAVNLNPT